MSEVLFKRIARVFPGLGLKLKQAGMPDKPEEFVKKTVFTSFYMTTGIIFMLAMLLLKLKALLSMLFFVTPVLFILFFFYFLKLPDAKIMKKEREIDKEIVFAGRFLIIELESGVPLYDAIRNVAKNYKVIGKYFNEIIETVNMGTTLEDALNEAIEYTPSQNYRKILWQIINSLKTGADISHSLNSVVEQITKEQIIKIKEYGRKLNPIAMFYMMIAVIMPTLGVTMIIILSNFISLSIDRTTLAMFAVALGFLQWMFVQMIKSSRPAVDL